MVRRPDFRLTVWLVAYVSLTVSSMVLEDFSTPLEMTGVGDVRRSDSRHQEGGVLCTTKTRIRDPCQSVLRASQNQASTLDCRKETPCSNPELVVRECGLMLDEMISVLWLDCHGLTYSAESVLPSGRLGSRRGGKREICIQRFIDSSLLKLHSGRNIRDIQGR